MDSPLDSLRTKVPWMKDLSDDEILLKASEITGKPVHDIADYYGVTTGVDRNALSAGLRSGWEDIKGLGYSAAAAGADIVGAKDTRDWLNKQADKRQAASQIESRPDLENVENVWSEPSKWGPYGIYQIGKQVPNLAAGIGTGLLVPEVAVPAWLARGAAVGPKVLGMGGARAGMSYAEREAAIKAGQTFGKQVVGGGAFNEAQSLGSLYQEAVDAGRPEASGESLLKSIPYAISETGPEAMLAGRFLHGSGLKGNIARRMGISGAIQGASGATSEAIQNELEMSMHPEGQLTPEQIASRRLNSPVAGGLVEGVLGSFGGVRSRARAPISTAQPADLTKRLPDEAYDAQVERMHGMESGALGIRTPEEQSAFVQKQAERDLLGGLYPPAAPAAPTYGTDYADQLAQAHGMPPGSFSPIVAPVAPAAVKPKAAANAARDAAAAPVDPVIAQITEVKNQLRDPYIESHLPADHTKTPGQIHQAITRLVGDPQTMDEAAATLKGKIAAVLTPGQGKGSKVERTARAEKMIQFYDNIVGTPDAERMTAEQWEENLKAESAAAAQAAALANAKVGEAGKLPGAVTTIDPNAVATPPTTPSTAATAAPTPPGVPPKPTNPAELPAYQAAITPHLLAGVLPGELQALQLVHRVNAENAGDTEAAAASLRAAAKESGIPHTTLADRANRGLAKIEANATKVGLPVEAAQALLGMETSLDMADVATPTTGYEGQGRVVTAPSEEFEPEAGYAREETAAQEGEALPEEGAAEGEAAPEVAVEAAPRAEFENKWVDAQGQPISHADVQDAAEDYGNHEMGYAAGDPKWEQLSPKLQLQWVRGYLAAYDLYPKAKQAEQRRGFTDVVRTAMAEGEEQPSEATPRDTGTEGADTGPAADREAEKGPDDTGAAQGVGREVGAVPAADEKADTGRVPPAGTAGEKAPVAGEAGKGAEAAPVVKRKRKVVVETKPTEATETKPAETKPAETKEAPKEAPTTTEAAGRTVREVRARRQWLDAYEREPAIGKWDELSKKSQEEFIAANDDEQSFDDVVDIKLADPSGEVLQKALAEKEKAAKAKKAPAEKTTESADERAERKWGELHALVPMLGPWNELTPEGRQEFTTLSAKKQNIGSAEQVKTKDERWKQIAPKGNLKSAAGERSQLHKLLHSGEYVFHAVRNDEDIAPIFQSGLKYNTNISLDPNGQAFEDEGATILVFRKEDTHPRTKGYQNDGLVSKTGAKPVAIIKDTSLETRAEVTDKALDDEADRLVDAINANNKLADGLWRGAGLEKEANDEDAAQSLNMAFYRVSLRKGEERAAADRALREKLGDFYDRAKEVAKESDRLDKQLDALNAKMERGAAPAVTPKSVLARYKQFGIPTYDLSSEQPGNMLSAMEDVAATGGVNAVRMANLMGSQLYGKMNDIGPVTIKELFQNAFDALKGAMEKGGRDHGNISVDLNEDARTITVKDDGTGMTADTINNAFLTLAGTNKETDRPSGSFGVAKMLFLFGNKSLKLVTVRNGIESTLETTGAKQLAAFHDPSKAVPIKRQKTDKSPGTTITIELPETYREENVDKPIKFPERWQASSILNDSPLFENITVRLNGDEMRIGKNFPKDEYTVLTVAKFPWGKVRVLVAPVEYAPFENASVLSNGVIQFNEKITKDPSKPYSGSVPYRFFFNVEPSVKADAPDYPFALNRQGISLSAKNDFEVLQKYINIMYANTASEANSQSFGVLSQFDEDGTSEKKIDLNVPTAKPGTTLKIDKNDKVEIRDGRMYINNRAVPELTKEQMKAMQHDPTQFRVDQSKLDPDLPIVHDNVLLNDKPYLEEARRELGDKPVNDYLLGVSRVFKQLRDAAKKVGGKAYEDIDEIPVGISIDTKYYGVNTMIPFRAMMLNPTVTKGGEIKDAANIIVGTMIHELAHHAERNHSETGFIPELQRLFVVMAQSRDMSKAIANLQRVIDANAQVYNYFIKEQDSGNLKNRGIRLESGAQVIEGEGAADRTAEPSGGGRDAGDGTGLYQAVGTGNQNRPAGQGRAGAPATNATRAAKAAGTKHLTNVTTFAKTHGLGFMITEDIADLAAHNGLPEVRTYVDAAKTREGERVRFEQPVGRIAEQYDALPQHERGIGDGSVNKFIHDATVKGSLDGIKRFSAAGQKLINDVFQHGKDTLALKKKLIEQEVGREYDTRIKAETDPAKQDELRKEKKLLLSRYSKLMTIKNSDTYAPLKRFGDYVVSAKSAEYVNAENNNDKEWISENQSDPNHYQVHFAESQGEADALAESLKPQFAGGKLYAAARDADIRNQHDLFRAFPVLMTRLREEFPMQGGKVSPMERIIRDLYLQALAENSARKNEMRRRGITGASTDMIRSFVTQGRADASFLANLKHNDALQNAVQGMRNGAERDPRNLTPYLNEMLQRHAASYETQSADWANKIKRTTSIWLLATNPTYYLQQLVQPTSMSHPVIAGQQGWWRTGRALAKGYSDMMPLIKGTDLTGHIDWNTAPADVRDVLTTLANNGAIDVTNTMDQGEWETAGAKSKAGAVWNRIDRRLRGLNTRVEALNRSVTAAAAYRLELARNGGDKAVATRYAEAMVRQTHGSYDGSNTPRYLQGTYKGLLTQFRRFQIIQISLIARLAHTAFKGANAVERGIARRALTYTLLHTAAIGGTLGMPGAALLTSLIARLFGPSDEPPDFEKLAREAIDDQTISDLLLKGVPAMLGVDLSSKFGMGNMLSINAFSDFPHDRKSFQDYVFGSLGPTVGMGAKAMDGAALMYKGDVAKGAEQLLPSGFANAMKGYRIGTEGVSLRKGDTVLAPEELGFADALLQGLGMPTTTITHQQRLSQTKYEFDTYYKDRANELIHDYQQARKDGESTADVIADWQNLQEGRVRNGYTRQPLSFLLKSAQMQMKRERGTAGGVEFTKANKRFVQEQAGL